MPARVLLDCPLCNASTPLSNLRRRLIRAPAVEDVGARSLTSKSGCTGSFSITNGAWWAPKNPGPPAENGLGIVMYGGTAPREPTSLLMMEPSDGCKTLFGIREVWPSANAASYPVIT